MKKILYHLWESTGLRTYTSLLYGMLGVKYDLVYHCTDSLKILVGPAVKLVSLDARHGKASLS